MVNSKVVPIHSVTELVGGGTPPRSKSVFFGGPIPWVTPSDLPPIGNVAELGEVRESLTEAGLKASSAKLLRPPAVLFSSRASIGKIAVATRACATNQGFINFIPDLSRLDPWFLAYYLRFRTPDIIQLSGETTYKEVSRGRMRGFPLLLPPLTEQRRIVSRIQACLARVDEVEKLQSGLSREGRDVFPSAVRAMYLELCKTRPTVPLRSLVSVVGGGTPSKDNSSFWRGDIPWISPKDMKVREIFDSALHISKEATERTPAKLIQPPAVLLVVRGMILQHTLPVAIQRVPAAINQDMKALRPNESIAPEFLRFMLCGASLDLLASVEIAGHGTRRLQTEKWINVPIPKLSQNEQALVNAKLDAIDRAAGEALELGADPLSSALRDSVLRHAFAGEL